MIPTKIKSLFKRLSTLVALPAWLAPLLMLALLAGVVQAATAGLPFTEDFADTNLQDPLLTNANWSTEEQALILAWRKRQYGAFGASLVGGNISGDTDNTTSVALGDVDGDGDLDLVVGNDNQPNRLYLNNGSANPFSGVTGSNITDDADYTQSVALGDVDGDGDLDLVAGNDNAQTNRLYLNNGTADPFNGISGSDITDDADDTQSVALGDMDGDGDLDLVTGNSMSNRLYLNNGTANPFVGVSGSNISADTFDTWSVALGDLDGDGDLDLVAANLIFNRLYLNNGTADPFAGVNGIDISNDPVNTTFSVALGDMDGDGDLDLVAGNGMRNRLYLNNGTADPFNGVSGSNITDDNDDTNSVTLGDVDGDGDLDLVAGNDGLNRLYLNNGTADPFNGVSGSDITTDADNTLSVALGDVDGDGDLDLVAGNEGQTNRLYLNNGMPDPFNGISGSNITADTDVTMSVALGDVDGDGDLDLVAGNYDRNQLYLNNGTSDPFNGVSGSDITDDAHASWSVALGDVDGDGDLDLVAGNHVAEPNRLYLNNGTADPFGGITGSDITTDDYETHSVALGDVDGDGDLDMVAGNNGQTNRLYLNNGTADPFAGVSGSDITVDTDETMSVALGDMDGDGDLDLVAGNDLLTNRLYLNNGTADPFAGVSGSDITADVLYNTWSVALGDVDGDGDLDIVVGNVLHTNRLYLNNGTATPFAGVSGSDISADAGWTASVVLGDVDGDGDLDMVTGQLDAQPNRLYLNNGTADPFAGVSGSDITSDIYATFSVTLGDVDDDGDLDLVSGNNNQTNRLYQNGGTANPFNGVSGSDITTDADDTRSVALGDMDGDGDLDLVVGNVLQPNRLYLNNGTADPFNGVSGVDITSDIYETFSVALGDVDGDGDLDLVAGNGSYQANRLYLNNGTADPFNGVSGSNISSDAHNTESVALGDVDGDGDLDLVAGNDGANRQYLNNGTADPFAGVSGSNISSDVYQTRSVALGDWDGDGDLDLAVGNNVAVNQVYENEGGTLALDPGIGLGWESSETNNTYSVAWGDWDSDGDLDLAAGNLGQVNQVYENEGGTLALDPGNGLGWESSETNNTYSIAWGDVDGDGDLDLVAGNLGQANRLYLNNGTADPFNGVSGSDITSDAHDTASVALGDVDGDGDLDLVAGNYNQANRLYRRQLYHTRQGQAGSLRVDTETTSIDNATLTHLATLPPNTGVTYWLSNNGGAGWFLVRPNVNFVFPTTGTDLRWRAELWSLSPVRTPRVEQLTLVRARPEVGLTKRANPTTAGPGQTITYTLVFSNSGERLAQNVLITDIVPVSLTNISVISSGVTIIDTGASPPYVWQVQDLAYNETGTITITGQISSTLAVAGFFTNTAEIMSAGDTTPANNRAEAGVEVILPDLTLSKEAASTTVDSSSTITYTVTVSNTGTSAVSSVVVSDTLPLSVTLVSSSTSNGSSYNPGTGAWHVGTVGGGSSVSLMIVVTGSLSQGTTITNTAELTECIPPDPDSGNNMGQAIVTIGGGAQDIYLPLIIKN